jgi:signal transduction histidine kinase
MAVGHGAWIEEIWVNYISNAVKYGGTPPHIELGATPGNGSVTFWVRDNGTGIPADKVNQLFKPFTRLDEARAKGYGLGLSIVKIIADRLGGEVGVLGNPDGGSTFFFTLPAV